MQAKPGVVEVPNTILTNELTAINQYFIHGEMGANWGYERLHHKFREYSIDEMKDAEDLIHHILYLEGAPNMQRLNRVAVGETVPEQLRLTLDQERQAVTTLSEAIGHCAQVGDFTIRNKLEKMVRDEEEHIDWLETQVQSIGQAGLESDLSQQLHS